MENVIPKRVIVIGAGPMGLAAAYWAAKAGHHVTVLEAASDPGGMAGHFDFGGLSLERFYHFVCKSDTPTFELMNELGIGDQMRWRDTSMGLFDRGKLHDWGTPLALLKLPGLSLIDKLRYGIFAFVCVRKDSWPGLETRSAKDWITTWCGGGYDRFWRTLFEFKFYEYADNISAAWIWTRIRRIGRSRSSILQEELGYIEGGSITLINALIEGIRAHGGSVLLANAAEQVTVVDGRVTGVRTRGMHFPADEVISTVPTPYVSALVPALLPAWKGRYEAIHNIGVICVIFKLRRSVSPHFWVNISQPQYAIPGIIEFSNLRDVGPDHIVYVPYYMPVTNPKFSWPDEKLLQESFACLKELNPQLNEADIVDTKIARLRFGQPICEPGFAAKIPPIQTHIDGLQIADTCFYYPEDRGIAESVRLAKEMAASIAD